MFWFRNKKIFFSYTLSSGGMLNFFFLHKFIITLTVDCGMQSTSGRVLDLNLNGGTVLCPYPLHSTGSTQEMCQHDYFFDWDIKHQTKLTVDQTGWTPTRLLSYIL